MTEPTFDPDGYPTEETLRIIKKWPADDPVGWLSFVCRAWWDHSQVWVENGAYLFTTGGWSGNEDLICVMRDNDMLWSSCWQSSHRGGRHVFRVSMPEPKI